MKQRTKEQDELRKEIIRLIDEQRAAAMEDVCKRMSAALVQCVTKLQDHEDELTADGEPFNDGVVATGIPGFTLEVLRSNMHRDFSCDGGEDLIPKDSRSRMVMDFLNFEKLRMDAFRKRYPMSFSKWKENDDAQLLQMFDSGASINEIASALQRNANAIRIRLEKLGRSVPGAPGRAHYPIFSSKG